MKNIVQISNRDYFPKQFEAHQHLIYEIRILQPKWDEDIMVWKGIFKYDTLKLCILKRKIDMAKELGLSLSAAYHKPYGTDDIEEMFGSPLYFDIKIV